MATKTKDSGADSKNHASSEAVQNVMKEAKPFQTFITKFNNDWSFNLAGALAYNLLLSTFPIVVALIAVLGFVLGIVGEKSTPIVTQIVTKALPGVTNPSGIVTGVQNTLTHSAGPLLIISVVSAIVLGSRLFVVIENFFAIIYRLRPRAIVRQNLMAIGMLLAFIIFVPLMGVASSLPVFAFSLFKDTPLGPFLSIVGGILGSLLVSFLLFELIYIVVPNQRISFRHSWLGAVIAAIALQIYLLLFPLYATNFLKGPAGAVGLTVILIVFFYYFGLILFLGAEVNAFFSEKVQPLPNDLATFTSTMAGRLNKDRPEAEGKSHVDARPTDQADEGHVAEARDREGRTQQKNARRQKEIASTVLAKDNVKATAKAKDNAAKGPSKTATLIEVAAGTVLTVVIELLRLRRHGK